MVSWSSEESLLRRQETTSADLTRLHKTILKKVRLRQKFNHLGPPPPTLQLSFSSPSAPRPVPAVHIAALPSQSLKMQAVLLRVVRPVKNILIV